MVPGMGASTVAALARSLSETRGVGGWAGPWPAGAMISRAGLAGTISGRTVASEAAPCHSTSTAKGRPLTVTWTGEACDVLDLDQVGFV